jgi:hypothetical protein
MKRRNLLKVIGGAAAALSIGARLRFLSERAAAQGQLTIAFDASIASTFLDPTFVFL